MKDVRTAKDRLRAHRVEPRRRELVHIVNGIFAVALMLAGQVAALSGSVPVEAYDGTSARGDCCCVDLTPVSIGESAADDCCAGQEEAAPVARFAAAASSCGCHTSPRRPDGSTPPMRIAAISTGFERQLSELNGRAHANERVSAGPSGARMPSVVAAPPAGGGPGDGPRASRGRATSPARTASMRGVPAHLALLSVARL